MVTNPHSVHFQVAIKGGNTRVTAALVNFESDLNRLHPITGETPLIAAVAVSEEVKKFRIEILQSLHHGKAQLEMKSHYPTQPIIEENA